jgi:hypothetical protein
LAEVCFTGCYLQIQAIAQAEAEHLSDQPFEFLQPLEQDFQRPLIVQTHACDGDFTLRDIFQLQQAFAECARLSPSNDCCVPLEKKWVRILTWKAGQGKVAIGKL